MNSRYIASISLLVMAAGFIITWFMPEHVVIILLHGGFEAGLVGGFADWFAVTALFRHPMGIPIPHTSLLLKNKERIVESLISSVENELLNKHSIEQKLRQVRLLERGGQLLTKQLSRRSVRRRVLAAAITGVERLPVAQGVPYLQSALRTYVQQMDLKNAAEQVITKLLHDRKDEEALDYVLAEAMKWIKQRQTKQMLGQLASEKLGEVRMGGFMGFAVQAMSGFMDEDKLGEMLQSMIMSALRDLEDRDNKHREAVLRELRIRLFEFSESEEQIERLKGWVQGQLEADHMETWIVEQLEQLRRLIIVKLEEEREAGGRRLFAAYRYIMRKLNETPERLREWEDRILAMVIQVVEDNHYRIGRLIRENVDQMDDAALVSMLEDKVGKDLQWIRVNGAVCGFVIGVILAVFKLI